MFGALIQAPVGQSVEEGNKGRKRIFRAVRIGRVALYTGCCEERRDRATPTDFHHIAHLLGAGWLSDKASIDGLARLGHPIKNGDGAIGGVSLFIAGDHDRDRAAKSRIGFNKLCRCGHKGSDPGFHIRRAAPPDFSVSDMTREWVCRPALAGGNDIGMAVETEDRSARAKSRMQVGDAAAIRALTAKACFGQQALQMGDRSALVWRYGGALDQRCGQVDGINLHPISLGRQSAN